MNIEHLREPLIPVNAQFFDEYLRANINMPQVSDGIKWLTHEVILKNPSVDLYTTVMSSFSQDQLARLRTKSNRAHYAFNVPVRAVEEGKEVSSSVTPVYDKDYHVLWTRVKHSLVNNLQFYQSLNGKKETLVNTNYRSNLEHDLQQPSVDSIAEVKSFIRNENGSFIAYRTGLQMVRLATETEEGKDLLKAYRGEFRSGKRTNKIWRQEGYGEHFAKIVKGVMSKHGINSYDPDVKNFLFLNKLSDYSVFSDNMI